VVWLHGVAHLRTQALEVSRTRQSWEPPTFDSPAGMDTAATSARRSAMLAWRGLARCGDERAPAADGPLLAILRRETPSRAGGRLGFLAEKEEIDIRPTIYSSLHCILQFNLSTSVFHFFLFFTYVFSLLARRFPSTSPPFFPPLYLPS